VVHAGHARRLGRADVGVEVVDEHARGRGQAELGHAEREDRRVRLAQAASPEITTASNSSAKRARG